MRNQKDVLNKLIPADDLFWDKYEGKYIALSYDEIDNILQACMNSNIISEDDLMKVVNWCTSVRVGELLMKGFITGKIGILEVDKDGEPIWVDKPSGGGSPTTNS